MFVNLQEAQIRKDLSSYLARGLFPDLSHRQLHFLPSFLYWNLSCNPYFHRVSLTCLELYHLLTWFEHFTGPDSLFIRNRWNCRIAEMSALALLLLSGTFRRVAFLRFKFGTQQSINEARLWWLWLQLLDLHFYYTLDCIHVVSVYGSKLEHVWLLNRALFVKVFIYFLKLLNCHCIIPINCRKPLVDYYCQYLHVFNAVFRVLILHWNCHFAYEIVVDFYGQHLKTVKLVLVLIGSSNVARYFRIRLVVKLQTSFVVSNPSVVNLCLNYRARCLYSFR